jgi:nucleoid-associated protein YgaU
VAEANDSFWTISQKLYGTGAYYEALLKHNRSKYSRADQLRWGDVISAPSAEELARLYPDLCPKPAHREAMAQRAGVRGTAAAPPGTRTYVVQNGDTIYDIARSELGSATRWNEVYQLNRETLGKHPEYITPGMRLVLPEDSGSPGVLTRRPGSGYMR